MIWLVWPIAAALMSCLAAIQTCLRRVSGGGLISSRAPKLEIVKRAAVVITHAGLNTTRESLAEGVPLHPS
jgi:UDP:flavonoid glycosyltransferase YjiC (YdhE family)